MREGEIAELYERYGHLVLRRCRLILRDAAEAEDAMQEVFLRVLKYGDSIAKAEGRLAWLYRTAERHCFDRLARRKREPIISPEETQGLAQAGAGSSVLEARDVVLKFLDRFEAKLRQLALLHYLDGLTQEEIAAQLGWSRRTVGKKLKKLRARAEILMRSVGGAP